MITISDYRNLKTRCIKRVWLEKNNKSVLENKNNERLEESILIRTILPDRNRHLKGNNMMLHLNIMTYVLNVIY